jgi:methylphosphotriester-DNA--protein-cysteine methyltransferase
VRALLSLDDDDDPAALRQCLADHLGRTPFDALLDRMRERVQGPVATWLEAALRSPVVPRTPSRLAVLAGCSPRTLRRTLRAAGLPGPERLLAWRLVLHAARLLEDGRSADSVARALECSSGSALRRCLKRMTGLRPAEVAGAGGLRLVSELFLRECPSPTPACDAAGAAALAGSGRDLAA